jgi:hypothetical protein
MIRDDITRMVKRAGGATWAHNVVFTYEQAARFLALEREACAQVAENGHFLHDDSREAEFGKACAAAIRARGEE